MDCLFGPFSEVPQNWLSHFSEVELTEKGLTHLDKFKAQEIVPGLWFLPDIAKVRERGEETVGCSLGKSDM
jgi:hypothetical protein